MKSTRVWATLLFFALVIFGGITQGCGCDTEGIGGAEPKILVEPKSYVFEAVSIGQSRQATIRVKNVGFGLLSISSLKVVHETAGEAYTLLSKVKFPLEVETDQSVRLRIEYKPKQAGANRAHLRIESNAQNATDGITKVPLRSAEVAADIVATPNPMDFKAVEPGKKKTMTLTVSNRGKAELQISEFKFKSNKEKQYSLSELPKLPAKLAPGKSVAIKVTYEPKGPTALEDLIVVNSSAIRNYIVKLVGKLASPQIEVTPKSLHFTKTLIGSKTTKSFLIKSVGGRDLIVKSILLGPGTSTDFSLENPPTNPKLPLTLKPGEEKKVFVTYKSSDVKDDKGVVKIESNAGGQPVDVLLNAGAQGCDLQPTPIKLFFSGKKVQQVAIANRGNKPCKYQGASFSPSTSPEFSFGAPPPPGQVIQPGSMIKITVAYNPKDAVPDIGDLVVTSDDPDTPQLKVPLTSKLGSPYECDLLLEPATVQFGFVALGKARTKVVKMTNKGFGTCKLTNLTISPNPSNAFALRASVQGKTIGGGQSINQEIVFTPPGGSRFNGVLNITSNDRTPVKKVGLIGTTGKVCIEALPDPLDFGSVKVNCSTPKETLEIFNLCTRRLQVKGIKFGSNTNKPTQEFFIKQAPMMPRTLNYGQSFSIQMTYVARNLGRDIGTLELANDVPGQSPVAINLIGQGVNTDQQKDVYKQLNKPKIDILFVVDDSGSMGRHQTTLASNFNKFITWAAQLQVDYHIGIVTTDPYKSTGCLRGNPKFIQRTTPGLATAFKRNVNVGTRGSASEKAFNASHKALTPPNITGCNNGFYRKDASISVIYVSDEREQSTQPVNFYVNFLRNLKGIRNPDKLRVSAIGPTKLTNGTCSGSACRFYTISKTLRGIYEYIGNPNWGNSLSQLGSITFGYRTQFFLSRPAHPGSISVKVNGRSVLQSSATGWTYDGTSNSVNFSSKAVPPANSVIEITYRAICLPP